MVNKKDAIKYLILQKVIRNETIEKFHEILETVTSMENVDPYTKEMLVPLDTFITVNREIEFFLTKFVERMNVIKRREDEGIRKQREMFRKQ